jgi:hypothetical protein
MKSIASACRLLFPMLMVLLVAPLDVRAEPGADAQRARRFAARRYVGMAVSLPVTAFANGLRICSREMPSGIAGYWKVPPKAVDAIDAELLVHLRKSGLEQKLSFSAKLYIRQYAGFVRDGARFVYVNALLVEKGKPAVDVAKKELPHDCNGASGSWGIQYDTKTKKFSGFAAK